MGCSFRVDSVIPIQWMMKNGIIPKATFLLAERLLKDLIELKEGQITSPKEKIGFSPLVCIAIKVILKSLIVRAKVGETEGKTRSNIQDKTFHLFF